MPENRAVSVPVLVMPPVPETLFETVIGPVPVTVSVFAASATAPLMMSVPGLLFVIVPGPESVMPALTVSMLDTVELSVIAARVSEPALGAMVKAPPAPVASVIEAIVVATSMLIVCAATMAEGNVAVSAAKFGKPAPPQLAGFVQS